MPATHESVLYRNDCIAVGISTDVTKRLAILNRACDPFSDSLVTKGETTPDSVFCHLQRRALVVGKYRDIHEVGSQTIYSVSFEANKFAGAFILPGDEVDRGVVWLQIDTWIIVTDTV